MNDRDDIRLVALISGRGSNLQAILDNINQGQLPAKIAAVVSNHPHAAGLKRAQQAQIPTHILEHGLFPDRQSFDQALRECIDGYHPHLLILAGFMRILTDGFVNHYRGRLINIHPSLLPKFRGLDTHHRVLVAGDREHGASVHFVIPELDAGPIIIQARVPILAKDNADTLADRVLEQEHRIYPLAIRWFAEGRVHLGEDDKVWFDGQPRETPWILAAEDTLPD